VLELDDLEDRAVDLDVVAVLELVGGDRGDRPLLESRISMLSRAQDMTVGRRIVPTKARREATRRYFWAEAAGRAPPRPSSMPIEVEGGLIS
jgi:hypothetical protein